MDVLADIHFDGWTLRRNPRELLRDGVRVKLQAKPLQVLEALLGAPGELVTREHLIATLWPKRIVEFDAALNAAVRRLRSTLGDEAETPRYIETVPREGYRFVGTIHGWSDLAPVAPEPLIASVPKPKPMPWTWRDVARSNMAKAAAVAIVVVGIGSAWAWHVQASRAAGADTVLVAEAMDRARFFLQRRHNGDFDRARSEFGRVLSLSPKEARAWAGLASVNWLEFGQGLQTREAALPKLRDAAQHALELDPRLAEAHLRLSTYLFAIGQREAAMDHQRQAIANDPDDPLVLNIRAADAAGEGRWDEAIVFEQRAMAAEPLSVATAQNLAGFLFLAGRMDEAKKQSARAFELDPMNPSEVGMLAEILDGHYEQALAVAERWPEGEARDLVLALAYHALGREHEAEQRLEHLKTSDKWGNNVSVAGVYSFWGDLEQAFHWLENPESNKSVECDPMLFASPLLKPLHADARWAKLTRASIGT